MLNSTKTWQEEFKDKFWIPRGRGASQHFINKEKFEEVKQFISDLRKKDEEELIKMFPPKAEHNEWCEHLEDRNMPCDCGVDHHNYLVETFNRIIIDYYEK